MKKHIINQIEDLEDLSKLIIEEHSSQKCIALHGNLGAGKTTFVKAFCKQLGFKEIITSPTYSLVNEYVEEDQSVFHLDLYRLNSIEEALNIGIEEILDHDGYIFIEWPEIIEDLLPENTLNIYFSYINNERSLNYE